MNFKVEGEPFPVAICELEKDEFMICQGGAMSWMSPNMKMETSSRGGLGKVIGRAFTKEKLFMNKYTAEDGPGMIAFAARFPGCIRQVNISPDHELIVQKSGFLASTEGVELSVFFQKKLGAGLFGGEGFIMQKLSGTGTAFIELDGYIKEYDLAEGQSMLVDTGYLAAMTGDCTMEVVTIPGFKNVVLGGEGLFNTQINGPGKLWIQSMPIMQIAQVLIPYLPKDTSSSS